MKTVISLILLTTLAFSDTCWDNNNKEYIEFLFIDEVMELEINAVDKDLRPLFVFQAEGFTVDYDTQKKEYMYYCERKD